ncbi:MAG: hypothetical protein WEB50_02030, partial [Vicinamibacterales bacterium]
MLNDNDKKYLFRALDQNRCVLFVGAGFSIEATNSLGKQLPGGDDLAAQIWQWLWPTEPYDGSPLGEVFDAALRSGRPMASFTAMLGERLLVKECPEYSFSGCARVIAHDPKNW